MEGVSTMNEAEIIQKVKDTLIKAGSTFKADKKMLTEKQ